MKTNEPECTIPAMIWLQSHSFHILQVSWLETVISSEYKERDYLLMGEGGPAAWGFLLGMFELLFVCRIDGSVCEEGHSEQCCL